jgi:alcohol dehydrogenase
MTGYESAGIIINCGSQVRRFQVGDRVIAFYGHRSHAIIPETKAIAVPKNVPDALALLSILTCDVSKGIRKVVPQQNEAVLIAGSGAIGLLTIFMLKAYGVRTIDVVEPRAERRAMALQLGARMAIAPRVIAEGSELYPVAFECSSRDAAFKILQRKMQQGGRICILSDGNIESLTLKPDFHEKELIIVGSSDGWDYQEHAKWFVTNVREFAFDLENLFDYRTSADDLIATFNLLATGTIAPIKVLVRYNSDDFSDYLEREG